MIILECGHFAHCLSFIADVFLCAIRLRRTRQSAHPGAIDRESLTDRLNLENRRFPLFFNFRDSRYWGRRREID